MRRGTDWGMRTSATAGMWVMVGGIDDSMIKTSTVVSVSGPEDASIFRPLQHTTRAVVKLALEPLNPSELPKMLDGLRKVGRTCVQIHVHRRARTCTHTHTHTHTCAHTHTHTKAHTHTHKHRDSANTHTHTHT